MKPHGVIPYEPADGIPMMPFDKANHEIERISDCVRALDELPDWDARQRVLHYLCSRYRERPAETQEVKHGESVP